MASKLLFIQGIIRNGMLYGMLEPQTKSKKGNYKQLQIQQVHSTSPYWVKEIEEDYYLFTCFDGCQNVPTGGY